VCRRYDLTVTVPLPDRAAALAELADASTAAARLAELAHAFPDLGTEISAHPNSYPDLVDWLKTYGSFASPAPAAATKPSRAPKAPETTTPETKAPASKAPAEPVSPSEPRLTHPGLWAGLTFAAAGALAFAVVVAQLTQPYGFLSQVLAGGSAPYDWVDDDGGDYVTEDDGTGAVQYISCPSGSSAVMWSEWNGGATLVCEFSSGGYRMIVANGGSIQETDDVTRTPTGYSSPLADVAFGGWSVWLPDTTESFAATSWGSTEWGDSTSDDLLAADSIQPCPSGTYPLSLSVWSGGWLLTCGTSDGTPTGFEYLDGSDSGSGGELTYAGGRYCGTADDGQSVCVSSAPSVVQVGGNRYTVESNYFAETGPGGPGEGTAAYGLDAPGGTAVEQVAYLVAILEKSGEARAMVNSVLAPLNACSVSSNDVQNLRILTQARTDLLAALRSTPVDQVPDGVNILAALTNAIDLSEQADYGYIAAGEQMAAGDCSGGKGTYRNAITIADQAEIAKQTFIEAWNANIAPQFGVRTFTARDI
jgi:hypothetical protein